MERNQYRVDCLTRDRRAELETHRVAHLLCWYLFEIPRHALHHRQSSGGVWHAWLIDRRQDCRDESATHLRRPPAVRFPAQIVGRVHLGAFPEPLAFSRPAKRCRRSARQKARQVVVAGVLRTRRDNPGGDLSTMRAKRPPNSRDLWCRA